MVDLDRVFTSHGVDDIVVRYSYSIKGFSIAETSLRLSVYQQSVADILSHTYLRLVNTLNSIGNDGGNDSPHTPSKGHGGRLKLYAFLQLDLQDKIVGATILRQFAHGSRKRRDETANPLNRRAEVDVINTEKVHGNRSVTMHPESQK